MAYLIHYTLVFSVTVLIVSMAQYFRNERKIAPYIGVLIFLALEAGTRIFLTVNFGKTIVLDSFDFTGLHIIGIVAGVVGLLAGILWWRTKKPMPWLLVLIMALVQIVVYFVLLGNYQRG